MIVRLFLAIFPKKKLRENKLKESKNSSKFSKKLNLKCQKPQNPATMTQLKYFLKVTLFLVLPKIKLWCIFKKHQYYFQGVKEKIEDI